MTAVDVLALCPDLARGRGDFAAGADSCRLMAVGAEDAHDGGNLGQFVGVNRARFHEPDAVFAAQAGKFVKKALADFKESLALEKRCRFNVVNLGQVDFHGPDADGKDEAGKAVHAVFLGRQTISTYFLMAAGEFRLPM